MVHRLIISYDGSGFAGWQRQPNAVTVQEVRYRIPKEEPFIVNNGGKLYVNTGHPKYRTWLMIFMRGATEAMQRMFVEQGLMKKPTDDKAAEVQNTKD